MFIFKGKNIFMRRGMMRGCTFEKQQTEKTHQCQFIETMKSQMQGTKSQIERLKKFFFQCKERAKLQRMILLQTTDKHFKFSSLLPQCHTTKGPKLSLIIIVNTQNDAHISLRGGGCGSSKRKKAQKYKDSLEIKQQVPFYFFTDFIKYLEIIINKAAIAQDEKQGEEILLALKWFNVMQEHLNTLCFDSQSAASVYDLIFGSFHNYQNHQVFIQESMDFYVFKVLFTFYMTNEKRFMKYQDQQIFDELVQEFESQLDIEQSNIWIAAAEFEITMIKAFIESSPNNSDEGKKLLLTWISQIQSNISSNR